jgi:hypothetical protein
VTAVSSGPCFHPPLCKFKKKKILSKKGQKESFTPKGLSDDKEFFANPSAPQK